MTTDKNAGVAAWPRLVRSKGMSHRKICRHCGSKGRLFSGLCPRCWDEEESRLRESERGADGASDCSANSKS